MTLQPQIDLESATPGLRGGVLCEIASKVLRMHELEPAAAQQRVARPAGELRACLVDELGHAVHFLHWQKGRYVVSRAPEAHLAFDTQPLVDVALCRQHRADGAPIVAQRQTGQENARQATIVATPIGLCGFSPGGGTKPVDQLACGVTVGTASHRDYVGRQGFLSFVAKGGLRALT